MDKSFDCIWEEIHSEKQWGQYPSEDVIRFVARNYYNYNKEERKKIKILDFGCGAGANTWYLAREGFNVYAFDGSNSALDRAKSHILNENLNVSFKQSDALELDYKQDFFDCIIDSACIYANLIENIIIMYKMIYNFLKVGGKFFTTGNFGTSTTGYGTGVLIEKNTFSNITIGPLKNLGIGHIFLDNELNNLLFDIGFKINKCGKVIRIEKDFSETQIETIVEYYFAECSK